MASNACTDESLEINGSGFIQVAGNFSVKDIFQKKKHCCGSRMWFAIAPGLEKLVPYLKAIQSKNLQVSLSLSIAILFLFSETWRPLQWRQLTLSFLTWRRYQRSRRLVHCSHWKGAELRWPHISHPQTLCPLLLCFGSSHISLLPNPPTRCSPISSLFSAPSSPASLHKLDIFQLFPFLVQNHF